MKFISLLFFFSFLFLITYSYIVFPLKDYDEFKEKDVKTLKDFLDQYKYIRLYSELFVGEPPQKVNALFMSPNEDFIIINQKVESKREAYLYFPEESTSYKVNKTHTINKNNVNLKICYETFHFLENEGDISLIYSQKNGFFIDANKYKDFRDIEFLYFSPEKNKDYFSLSVIGLFNNPNEYMESNLIKNLMDLNYINVPVYSLQIIDNSQYLGNLVIGAYPHDYNPEKYFEDQFMTYKAEIDNRGNWGIKIEKSFIKDDIHNSTIDISNILERMEISINRRLTIAPLELFYSLKDIFFIQYFETNYCTYKRASYNDALIIIYCLQSKLLEKDYSKFPTINLYVKEFDYTFELDYEDLFSEYEGINNIVFFNIGFQQSKDGSLLIGSALFNNYQFTFNVENNEIGFYKEDEFESKRFLRKMKKIFSVKNLLIFIILIILLIVGFYFLIKYLKKRRERSPSRFSKNIEKLEGQKIEQSYELKVDE